jgi:hypothetical protein
MYSWIWRKLPGNWVLKLIQSAVLLVSAMALMYFLVFPWLDTVIFPETETQI